MRVLGIDQSFTSTGYCILDDLLIVECGIITSDKNTDMFDRASYVAQKLGTVCNNFHPKIIGLEGIAFNMRGNVTRDLAGLQFVIMIHLRQLTEKTIEIVNPKKVKKFATGNGSASKDELYKATPLLTKNFFTEKGFKKTKGLYDATDAFWIARYLYEEHT